MMHPKIVCCGHLCHITDVVKTSNMHAQTTQKHRCMMSRVPSYSSGEINCLAAVVAAALVNRTQHSRDGNGNGSLGQPF